MTHIPKDQWLVDSYLLTRVDSELLRLPVEGFQDLTEKEQDKLRQTEIFQDETVQLLGSASGFHLVRKYDGTLGWVPCTHFESSTAIAFPQRLPPREKALDFLQRWEGVPYLWGGLSSKGIDCSGFSQLYYLHVHNILLPKNSFDQRKLGSVRDLSEIKDHDLIFCYHTDVGATHHVVIYLGGLCWHARRRGGIVCQTLDEFLPSFKLEEIKAYLA